MFGKMRQIISEVTCDLYANNDLEKPNNNESISAEVRKYMR